MPGSLPEGEPAPADGRLPGSALTGLGARPFGVYVHVPFCATRCGYCDFNTYTAAELGPGASRHDYADVAVRELRLARRVLGDAELPVSTVFFGGGTPTLLAPRDLARILDTIRAEFGLRPDAEVTTEANPDSVDRDGLEKLATAGFNRISFGMQSAVPHVLRALDRTHDPGGVADAVRAAREAGFRGVSLDLIYGTPGESDGDWKASLDAALALGPDHLSAYALIVEPGTRLAARIRRGEIPAPDDDTAAARYVQADEVLRDAGFSWYEVSNWAVSEAARSRHNLLYWTGSDWWGIGPGAHSHVGGTRWWNVRHPRAYAARLGEQASPAAGREVLGAPERRMERIMLGLRIADGLPVGELGRTAGAAAARALDDGLLDPTAYRDGRLVLTLRGRLLADAVVRELTD